MDNEPASYAEGFTNEELGLGDEDFSFGVGFGWNEEALYLTEEQAEEPGASGEYTR